MLLWERHAYNMQQMAATLARYPDLNADQRSVFDTVRASLDAYQQGTLMQVKSSIWYACSIYWYAYCIFSILATTAHL